MSLYDEILTAVNKLPQSHFDIRGKYRIVLSKEMYEELKESSKHVIHDQSAATSFLGFDFEVDENAIKHWWLKEK